MGDDTGYDLDDPKHPSYADRMFESVDLLRKRDRESPAAPCEADECDCGDC